MALTEGTETAEVNSHEIHGILGMRRITAEYNGSHRRHRNRRSKQPNTMAFTEGTEIAEVNSHEIHGIL